MEYLKLSSRILTCGFIITFFTSNFSLAQQENCIATLRNGTVRGMLARINPTKQVCAYMSIPYAAAPVGTLRFQAPQPAPAWGTLNATSLPNWCPQAGEAPPGIKMSEDCLYLNVYQPYKTATQNGLPVLIWFHGGGFREGSSLIYTSNRLLARGDVILVVVQYRLGLLGFLSTGDSYIPGNNGLKDQAFSIRWVKENIKAFNGNSNQITIFGESAGGASVMFQLISPLNTGLIQGVIAQSGTALSFWAIDRKPLQSAQLMASRLGCPIFYTAQMVQCLATLPWEYIIAAQNSWLSESSQKMIYPLAVGTPVIEPNIPGAFISNEPETIMKTGNIPNVPLLIGGTKHDGSFILGTLYLAKFGPYGLLQNPHYMKQEIVPDILRFCGIQLDQGNRGLASTVELAYLSGANRTNWNETMPGLVDILSVFAIKSSIQNTAEILTNRGLKVYLYSFEHHSLNSVWSWYRDYGIPVNPGIAHMDDLMYTFDFSTKFSREDQSFSDLMCDLWINFARFGNPTPTPNARYQSWVSYNTNNEPFMKLNLTPTMQNGYRSSWRPNGFEWN